MKSPRPGTVPLALLVGGASAVIVVLVPLLAVSMWEAATSSTLGLAAVSAMVAAFILGTGLFLVPEVVE